MRISDRAGVCQLYPGVPLSAVEHLMWCIERAAPAIEAGTVIEAGDGFAKDLDQYGAAGGDHTQLGRLGALEILGSMASGQPARVVAMLARLGYAADGPEPGDDTMFLVVGKALDAMMWARARQIDFRTRMMSVAPAGPPYRVRGLQADRWAIVVLPGQAPAPFTELDQQLLMLQHRGAAVLPAGWRAPFGPVLDVRT